MKRLLKTLPLGSIATDLTSRPVILTVCLALLTDLSPPLAARYRARAVVGKAETGDKLTGRDERRLAQAIGSILVDLNRFCAPFTYCGRHPTTSDLGVWVDLGALHRAEEAGDLVQSPIGARGLRARFVLDASGASLTLYRRRGKVELWKSV